MSSFEHRSTDQCAPHGITVDLTPSERCLSSLSGAFLARHGLGCGSLFGSLLSMGSGAYLIYRGATGHCPAGDAALAAINERENQSSSGRRNEQLSQGQQEELASQTNQSAMESEMVDETIDQSFPASDPPSYSGATASPSGTRPHHPM